MSYANRTLCPMCHHWTPEHALPQTPPSTCTNCLLYIIPAGNERQFIDRLVPKKPQNTAPLSSIEMENQVGGVLRLPMDLSVESIFKKYDIGLGQHRSANRAKHYVKAKHEAIQLECWLTETFGKNPLKLQAEKVRECS